MFWVASAIAVEPCPVAYWAVAPPKAAETQLAIGEKVSVRIGDTTKATELTFAGRVVAPDGSSVSALFYDPAKDQLHIVPWGDVKWKNAEGGEVTLPRSTPVIQPINTANGTDQANVIIQGLLQIQHRGRLSAKFANLDSEVKVFQLFARLFGRMHYTGKHAKGLSFDTALHTEANNLTVTVKALPSKPRKMADQIEAQVRGGNPVILDFVPRLEEQMPFAVIPGEEPQPGMGWVPRLTQPTRSFLGRLIYGKLPKEDRHQALVIAVLEGPKGKRYLVVDPRNSLQPVLWDEKYVREVEGKGMKAWALRGPEAPKEEK